MELLEVCFIEGVLQHSVTKSVFSFVKENGRFREEFYLALDVVTEHKTRRLLHIGDAARLQQATLTGQCA